MYTSPDRDHYTPIITALVNCDELKGLAPRVVSKILSYLSTDLCITAIKRTYRGLNAIEYDIKSGKGVIVQVSSILNAV